MKTIGQMFRTILVALLFPALLLVFSLYKLGAANDDISQANQSR